MCIIFLLFADFLALGRTFSVPFISVFLLLISFHKIADAASGEIVEGRNGIVATDETRCSKIGRDILRRGGHAVDAAVASTLCLGVKSPMFSGIGGGGFMLVRSFDGNATVFDMKEMAPGRAYNGMYRKEPTQHGTGPMSIAVPGQLAGLYTAHRKYGKLPWRELVKPAKDLAGRGFRVSQTLYQKLVRSQTHVMADKELRRTFAPNGKLLSQGKFFKLSKLANTLALIGKHGMGIFYNGSIGQILAEDIRKAGGIVTTDDLKRYQVKIRAPLVAQTFGYEIVTAPPPASGGAVMIMILNILSNYKDKGGRGSLLMHRFVEALKFALALKTGLGDPGFVNIDKVLKSMISRSHGEMLRNRIKDNQTFGPLYYGNKWSQQHDQGTTHIIVVDRQRNVVTMTTSLNSWNGSQFMSPRTGIILNNHMFDFSYPASSGSRPPAPANFIQPFKRPLSSMAPTIVLKRGRVKAVTGAAGGVLIPDAVTQMLINYLNLNMSARTAMKSPRLYHMLQPNVLYYENYTSVGGKQLMYSSQILNDLRRKGHALQEVYGSITTVCQFVIQHLEGRNSGLLVGVSDPRKGGFPAAY